eukprot:m.90329 g.90329  ORF g.90329 m.90329 type:complete len:340 (+) comp15257_c0_seq2:542-1561(+)
MLTVMTAAVGALAAYVVASTVLLLRPQLLHRRKTHAFRPAHISHRGGAGEWIENTVTAFARALDNKTHMFELDVRLTRDNEVVVMHDHHLDRVTGSAGHISQVDFPMLPRLQTTLRVDFAPHMPHTTVPNPESIPRLEDMFKQFKDVPMNIDVKQDNDVLIEKVVQLVKAYDRQALVVWGNASDSICRKLRARLPAVPLFFSLKQYVRLYVLFYLGLLPFCSIEPDFLEIPMPASLIPLTRSPVKRAVLRVLDYLTMSSVLFNHLHRRGVQILLWVVNSEAEFHRACAIGAHGVMTDYPSMLTGLLDANHPVKLRNHHAGADKENRENKGKAEGKKKAP